MLGKLLSNVLRDDFYGWKLVAVFWVILFVNLGFPMYGSPVINAYMIEELAIDRRTLGFLFSVYMLMTGLPGPLVAMSVNRFGVRFTLILGSIFVLLGSLGMATWVTTGWQALLMFGIVVGAGVVTGGALAAQSGVAYWFIKRRALAISIILSSGGIGGFIAAPLLDRVIAYTGDWRAGWWLVAGLACISALAAVLFVRNKPGDLGQQPDGETEVQRAAAAEADRTSMRRKVHVTTEEWSFRETIRTPTLWLLMLASIGMSAGLTLFMAHGVVHLKDLGHSSAAAAMSFSILVISNLGGKVVLGVFGDKVEPRFLWAGATAMFGLGLVLAVNAVAGWSLYVYAVFLGMGFGGGIVCMMTVLSNYFGSKAYPSIIGIALAIQTTAGAAGSSITGDLYERLGSYAPSFYGVAALCFLGAVLLIFLRPPHKGESLEVPEFEAQPSKASS